MKTTAGIVNWNSGRHLQACVESLLGEPDLKILVFDNASQDDSLDFAGRESSRAQVVRSSENRGFAGGVNEILQRAETPYVLILNPDVQAAPGSIRLMEQFMDTHPRAAAIGGYAGEKYLPRLLPTMWTLLRENLGLPVGAVYDRAGDFIQVEQVAAAAIMIRREISKGTLIFDPGFYPAWYEDVDFCRRLQRDNWEVYFAPEARFAHAGGYSAKAMGSGRFVDAYYRNQVRYAQKWFRWHEVLAVRASVAAGVIGRMIARPSNLPGYSKVLFGALIGW
ncbi:MAG TPA: glycosyltransferase family 2 protein [Terriglobia bacterium]|jgi:hypothetical protein